MFRVRDFASLTGLDIIEAEAILRGGVGQPVEGRPGFWRCAEAAAEPAAPSQEASATAGREMLALAEQILRPVLRGQVQDPRIRELAVATAGERLRLAGLSAAADPAMGARMADLRQTLAALAGAEPVSIDTIIHRLADWTVGLTPAANDTGFDLDQALRTAQARAEAPGAVFEPARQAMAAGATARQDALVYLLDRRLREAALRSDVFAVLALAGVAAVLGSGRLADAILSAVTTPGVAAALDRTGRRILYAALSSLARPGADERLRAAQACDYLCRRDPSGRDGLELLAPAALQAAADDSVAAIVLISRWLTWEAGLDQQVHAPEHVFLPRLGHVARNLGCSLELRNYQPLELALPTLSDTLDGLSLVLHLGSRLNRSLLLSPFHTGLGIQARDEIASLVGGPRPRQFVSVAAGTKVANMIEDLRLQPDPVRSTRFRDARSRHAA